MSIILIGDLHLNNWKQFSTILPNGLNSRLADQMRVVGRIANILTDNDIVIFLGDLIDSYGASLDKVIYNAAFHTLKTWAKRCKHLYVLVGNHDQYRLINVLSSFDEIENVTIVSSTIKKEIDEYIVDMVPWEGELPNIKGDIFVGHVMPIGAVLGIYTSKKGDEGVPIRYFDGYRYVVSGHIHEPQDLFVPDSETVVTCLGSVMQLNLSSSSQARFMLKLEKNKLIKIPIESPKIYISIINSQEEADAFVKEHDPGYYKLIVMDYRIKFPPLDHTVVIEYEAKPTIGKRGIEDVKEMDLMEIINEFIDNVNTKIDKIVAKELIDKLQ